jgi:3',5'-cyclic AMP phosphodiesterase CpdA
MRISAGIRSLVPVLLITTLFVGLACAAQEQQIQQKLAALEQIKGKFSFVVLGDNRSGHEFYERIVAQIAARKPDFVVVVGDQIEQPGDRQEWKTFWELSKPITMPFFLTVGNHDISSKVPRSERTYKREVDLPGNELYYSFTAGNSLFIVLDSWIPGQEKRITGVQLKWLQALLTKSHRSHTFVFLHHPLYTSPGKGHHVNDSLDRHAAQRDRLEAVLKKFGVTAVFAGHEHYYERRTRDGFLHIITGGGGAPLDGSEDSGGFYHYIYVTVDGDRVRGEVVDINGKVRDLF